MAKKRGVKEILEQVTKAAEGVALEATRHVPQGRRIVVRFGKSRRRARATRRS